MRLTYLFLFVFTFILTQGSYASNQKTSAKTTALIERFFKEVGGKKALEELKTVERAGEIEFPDHGQIAPNGKGTYKAALIYPNKVHIQISVGKYIFDELKIDNEYFEFHYGNFRLVTDDTIKKQLDESSLKANRELLFWQKEHQDIALVEKKPKWAKNNDCVGGTREKVIELICFDKKSHLLTAAGSEAEYRIYSDWKLIENIKFPMKLTHYKAGVISYEIKLNTFIINQIISAADFEKPKNLK